MSAEPRSKLPKSALAARLAPRIRPVDTARRRHWRRWLDEAAAEAGLAAVPDVLAADPVLSFVAAVLDCSPFLRGLVSADLDRAAALVSADPARRLRALVRRLGGAWRTGDEAALMAATRRARQETALLVALADLGGIWDLDAVTGALTAFADAAVSTSVRFILAAATADGGYDPPDPDRPDLGSGWIVLGMGKYGAGELNYSSDIDLIVLFDREVAPLADPDEAGAFFVRLTRRLVRLLQEHTADGYVFRTDLRLRPDPGSTNVAISTEAALEYYESLGQNWERAALIKARPAAGDVAAGEAFLRELTPYIWRKYLDFAAIADIHSIKRQIHDHRGHEEIAVAGHNLKLGRGGIREIEFFVQTQQLIAGGRNPELRGRRTLAVLAALAEGGWIDPATRDDLASAYRLLRTLEHCLQMVDDQQTHTLPDDPDALTVVARMAGFKDAAALGEALTRVLGRVRDDYGVLFEAAPSLTSTHGSLVFTGDEDDPETLATLSRLGFANPAEVSRTVRSWHFGRYPCTRSSTARERLTEFVPALIEALAATDNGDRAFAAFDRFLSRLPAGVQLFSLLSSNPGLLGLLAAMMAAAPRLTETVTHRPRVLDALIEPAFFGRLPDRKVLDERLATTLAQARGYEDVLDRARIFGQEQAFLIGVRVLAGTADPRRAGVAYADLAEVLIAALLQHVRREFAAAHGTMPKGRVAVVAMGKLGGREMTAASDLDLIVLYDFDDKAPGSTGARPLAGSQYFARLTQRLLAALSAPTGEGSLYQVDFRLRPSGKSGPLATHIDAFVAYQAREAWTWEHMALTRARPVAGDASLVSRARKEIAKVLRRARAPDKARADVLEMRRMIEEEKGGAGPWDIKQAPGGLVDVEFIAQHLEIIHAARHPEIVSTQTETVLAEAARAGLLPQGEADVLLPALRLYQAMTQVLRLCVDGVFDPEDAPRGLLDLLARAGELPDFAVLDSHLRETQAAVRAAFERLIGTL